MNRIYLLLLGISMCWGCSESNTAQTLPTQPFIVVLGVAQDAGFPQAGCKKSCCKTVWAAVNQREMVSCIALVDPQTKQSWVFDATPDMKDQLHLLQQFQPEQESHLPTGIFLTHAHMGHYTGLMDLGREAMGTQGQLVYGMPRMLQYLRTNGPWSQLVSLQNIHLSPLQANEWVTLTEQVRVRPLPVPHRDEYSETVGFHIEFGSKQALFIPDIDKWDKWDQNITDWVQRVDYAFLDATFYQNGEIPNRDMSEIPHPFVEESMALFQTLPPTDKAKVHFLHFNHTNPLLQAQSKERTAVMAAGYRLAGVGEVYE